MIIRLTGKNGSGKGQIGQYMTDRGRGEFILPSVRAPERLRFERLRQRGRENDPKTFEEFKELESREAQSSVESDQQLDHAISMADITVENTGPLKMLHDQVRELL